MNDYIEQMAKAFINNDACIQYRISDEGNVGGWDRVNKDMQARILASIETAFQSLWIDREEHGLPEESKNIWFCEEDGTIHRGCYEGDRAWWDEDELELIAANVTHWMPMAPPPPPKRYETHPTA